MAAEESGEKDPAFDLAKMFDEHKFVRYPSKYDEAAAFIERHKVGLDWYIFRGLRYNGEGIRAGTEHIFENVAEGLRESTKGVHTKQPMPLFGGLPKTIMVDEEAL